MQGGAISRRTVGLALIFCTAIIWIVTSFISESLVKATGTGGTSKIPPFLLTWLATTLFTLYLPFIYIQHWVSSCWDKQKGRAARSYDAVSTSESGFPSQAKGPGHAGSSSESGAGRDQPGSLDNPEEERQTFSAALWSTPLWFLAQYSFNASLALTSVTSNTILSSTSSLFTFALAVMLLGEKFTIKKLICILACMLGTALVTLSDVEASEAFKATPPALPPPFSPPALMSPMRSLHAWSEHLSTHTLADPTTHTQHTADSSSTSMWGTRLQTMLMGTYSHDPSSQHQRHGLKHTGQLLRSAAGAAAALLSTPSSTSSQRSLQRHDRSRSSQGSGPKKTWMPKWLRMPYLRSAWGGSSGKPHKWGVDTAHVMSMWQRQHLTRVDQATESTKRFVNMVARGYRQKTSGNGEGVGEAGWDKAADQGGGPQDATMDDYDAPIVTSVSDEDDVALGDDGDADNRVGAEADGNNLIVFNDSGDSDGPQGIGDDPDDGQGGEGGDVAGVGSRASLFGEGDDVIPEQTGALKMQTARRPTTLQIRRLQSWLRRLASKVISSDDGVLGDDREDEHETSSVLTYGQADPSPAPPPSGPPSFYKSPLMGDLLVLLSAAFYGAYTVVLRLKMPGEEAGHQVAKFFGYVGLLTTVGLAPLVLLLLSTNVLDVSSIQRSVYGIILLEGMLDYVLSDYLWARAVMLLGPTVATLGLSVQIPLAVMIELMSGEPPQWTHQGSTIFMTLLGTLFILAGFVGINLEGSGESSCASGGVEHREGQVLCVDGLDGTQGRVGGAGDGRRGPGWLRGVKGSSLGGLVRTLVVLAFGVFGMQSGGIGASSLSSRDKGSEDEEGLLRKQEWRHSRSGQEGLEHP